MVEAPSGDWKRRQQRRERVAAAKLVRATGRGEE
jgi:hypothetical protein